MIVAEDSTPGNNCKILDKKMLRRMTAYCGSGTMILLLWRLRYLYMLVLVGLKV